jgi:hypothetical protein
LARCAHSAGMATAARNFLFALTFAAFAAAYWYYSQYDVDPPGGRTLWFGTKVIFGLLLASAFALGAVVARQWVVLSALGPLVIALPLHLQEKVGDFHDAGLPLNPLFFIWLLFLAGVVAAGAVVGAIARGLG